MTNIPYENMPRELASRSISLASMGVSDVGWSKEDALQVVRWALGAEIGILGGGVWSEHKGRWSAGGDGWFCEVQAGEAPEAYVARSCERAGAYVSSYPERKRQRLIFALELANHEALLTLQGLRICEAARRQLEELGERFDRLNLRPSEPEVREWRADGQYHAELAIVLRREGEAVAILKYPIFVSDLQVASDVDVRTSLRRDVEDLPAKP